MKDKRFPRLAWVALTLCCTVLLGPAADAQPSQAYQVSNLISEGAGRPFIPGCSASMGDRAYTYVIDGQHGSELWVTDGTAGGTAMIRDINPGRDGSDASATQYLTAGTDLLWMIRDDGVHGAELWKSDGTSAGTMMVTDTWPGPYGGSRRLQLAWKNLVFFSDWQQLWVSDGSAEGTAQLPGPIYPSSFAPLDDRVVFVSGSYGAYELWSSDGTEAGTSVLLASCPGGCPRSFAALGEKLYFRLAETELWSTDGTASGTGMIIDLGASFTPASVDGTLYLAGSDADSHLVLWRSDGTAQGTTELTTLPGDRSLSIRFSACGSRVLFGVLDNSTRQYELWTTDENADGAEMVAGGFLSLEAVSEDLNGRVLLAASATSETDLEVWVSDGTAAGTMRLVDDAVLSWNNAYSCSPSSRWFSRISSSTLMFALISEGEQQLWLSDGTPSGTRRAEGLPHFTDSSSSPGAFTAIGDKVLFTAGRANELRDLWVSDGSAAGTAMLAEEVTGRLTAGSSEVFFSGYHPTLGRQPHVSDGTPRGTHALADLGEVSATYEMAVAGDHLSMVGIAAVQQRLWRSDGTSYGTELLHDFNPDWNDCVVVDPGFSDCISYPYGLTPIGDALYLVAEADDDIWQLWRIDDSDGNLSLLMEGLPQSGWYPPADLTPVGDFLYFTGSPDLSSQPLALWRYHPGDAEPSQVWVDDSMQELTAVGDTLFFLSGYHELWKHDGVQTTLVADLSLHASPGYASQLTAAGDLLFFVVTNDAQGPELWVSDGTPAGTGLVKEIRPGPVGSYPESLRAVGGLLLFAADDGETGSELWVSNGSASGTRRVSDIAAGPAASSPASMTLAGDTVFFAADNGLTGSEPWAIPMQTLTSLVSGALFHDGFESADTTAWSVVVQ